MKRNFKTEIIKQIRQAMEENQIYNFYDLDEYVATNMSERAYDIFVSNHEYFANLVDIYYDKLKLELNGKPEFF